MSVTAPTCIVVANGARARFLILPKADTSELESPPVLVEVNDFINPEADERGSDLWSETKSGIGRSPADRQAHSYDDHRDEHMAEMQRRFSKKVMVAAGEAAIRKFQTQMMSMPDFSVAWTPSKADVSVAGDLGYTAGTYEMSSSSLTAPEKGKYVTIWKKQPDGRWMVVQDVFNADAGPAPGQHVMMTSAQLSWGDAPPVLPPGAKLAVISGDPGKAAPFMVRLQLPAGYQIPAHWHPTDENVTVISGTMALGMGDKFDSAALQELPAGSAAVLPVQMNHFAMAKTAAVVQVHGMGPFVLNDVNPADDPSKKTGV